MDNHEKNFLTRLQRPVLRSAVAKNLPMSPKFFGNINFSINKKLPYLQPQILNSMIICLLEMGLFQMKNNFWHIQEFGAKIMLLKRVKNRKLHFR